MTELETRSRASRKGWEARRRLKAHRDAGFRAALTDPAAPPVETRRGGALLSADESNPGLLIRRVIDSLKARGAAS